MTQRLVMVALFIVACSAYAQKPSSTLHLSDLKGLWLNKQYLYTLKETRSLCAAVNASGARAPYVEIADSGMQWENGFHDGAGFGIADFKQGFATHVFPHYQLTCVVD